MRVYTIIKYGCREWLRRTGRIYEGELIFLDARRRVTAADVKAAVSLSFGVDPGEMVSARRAQEVSHPRQVAMYLCKRLTPFSMPKIGRLFGDRDHTTVMHAVRQVEKRRASDPELDVRIEMLEREISAPRIVGIAA
jgi:chromosomal replication initiator protein